MRAYPLVEFLDSELSQSVVGYHVGGAGMICKNKQRSNILHLKGLSHEIDFKNVDENGQILALLRAAAGFWNFSEAPLIFC